MVQFEGCACRINGEQCYQLSLLSAGSHHCLCDFAGVLVLKISQSKNKQGNNGSNRNRLSVTVGAGRGSGTGSPAHA